MQDDILLLNNSNVMIILFLMRLLFIKYDFGWVFLCIGMVIGVGIVLMLV